MKLATMYFTEEEMDSLFSALLEYNSSQPQEDDIAKRLLHEVANMITVVYKKEVWKL